MARVTLRSARTIRCIVLATAAAWSSLALAQPSPLPSESRPLAGPRAVSTTRPPAAPGDGSLLTTGLALAGVVGAILVIGLIVRRAAQGRGGLMSQLGPGGRAPAGVLEVLGRYPVARGASLVLLKLDRRILLVSQTQTRRSGVTMSTLAELTEPEEVASLLIKTREEEGASMARRFQEILSREGSLDTEPPQAEPSPRLLALRGRVRDIALPRQPLAQGVRA